MVKKNSWWSAHQVRMVVEAQLDPEMPAREQMRQLRKVAVKIEYMQDNRKRAARSHRKKRMRKLRKMGIRISQLRKCFDVF